MVLLFPIMPLVIDLHNSGRWIEPHCETFVFATILLIVFDTHGDANDWFVLLLLLQCAMALMLSHKGGGPSQCDAANRRLEPRSVMAINGMYTFRSPLLKHTMHDASTNVDNANILGPYQIRNVFNICSWSSLLLLSVFVGKRP